MAGELTLSRYIDEYETITGKQAPKFAGNFDELFKKIEEGMQLPPRGQQAVDAGFTAHTLSDPTENPEVFSYYRWVIKNMLTSFPIKELSAQLIGTSFTTANVLQTDLPQPVTLNQWQIAKMQTINSMTKKAVILENNGVFIYLHKLHPQWPLINQSGNDFNQANNQIMLMLKKQGVKMTYLGDIDSSGIQIADHLSRLLGNPVELFDIQTPKRVIDWLVRFGKKDTKRTKEVSIKHPLLNEEMNSIHTLGKFVEQEQLIQDYEKLIKEWIQNQ